MTSVKSIFTIAFLSIIINGFGQNKTYTFLPKWKVGETKTLSIVQKETEYKAGELVEDTTTYLNPEITVLKETNDDYFVKIIYGNVALRSIISFYEKLGEDLSQYQNLELQYKVNKLTGKSELTNWKEAQTFMNSSIEQINALLKQKAPDMAGLAKLVLAPIKKMFKSKENIESYMNDEIGYLFFVYDKKFVPGDTLSITTSCSNPLNPTDTISQTSLSYLSNIDESKKTCDINTNASLDMTEFKKMMTQMMQSFGSALNIEDSSKNNAAKQINDFDFSITYQTLINFDYGTTWPKQVIKTAKVIATDPRGKTEKTVVSTITIH